LLLEVVVVRWKLLPLFRWQLVASCCGSSGFGGKTDAKMGKTCGARSD